jgi:hypothetical protein
MNDRKLLGHAAWTLANSPDVSRRLRAIGDIRRLLPLLEEEVVREARRDRWTWAMIAFRMGLSHQAVIKRWRTRMHGDGYDPMSSRIRPDRLPPRGPAPPRIPLWKTR